MMSGIKKMAGIVQALEKNPGAVGLERGLKLRLIVVEGMAVLHVGREGVRPSDEEMDVMVRAVEYVYKPLCIMQGLEDVAHGRWVKRFLYWPIRECKMAWKRAAVQMEIKL